MENYFLSIRLAFFVFMWAAAPAAAQPVTLERDSPLYAEPRLDAPQVAQLKLGAAGEVVGKQGAWLNLKTAGGSGWLFSFNVRFQSQQAGAGDAGAASTAGRLFGPRRNVTVTSSIGIRGIEEEDLRQAAYSAGQMKLLDGYVATRQAAERGARASGLTPQQVEFLGAK
jgi:hypothetical protein